MGKWATYRHRGAVRQANAGPPVPQPPEITPGADAIVLTFSYTDNEGGGVTVELADNETGPWIPFTVDLWDTNLVFPAEHARYYRAAATGNDLNYAGQGPWSPPFYYT